MNDQPAINPKWRISVIPKDAGNATEPVFATTQELEAVIANPSSMQAPQPIDNDSLEAAPRYNANVPYTPPPVVYGMKDQIVMAAIRQAIDNGWKDYLRFANDAVTIGMEAEAVITGMRKRRAQIGELLHNRDFVEHLWPNDLRKQLDYLLCGDQIKYLDENIAHAK